MLTSKVFLTDKPNRVKLLSPASRHVPSPPGALFGSKLSTASMACDAKSARRSSKPPKKSCQRSPLEWIGGTIYRKT
jgi:hypothetical protein